VGVQTAGGGSAYILSEIYIWGDSLERQVSDVGSEGSHPGFMWGNTSYS